MAEPTSPLAARNSHRMPCVPLPPHRWVWAELLHLAWRARLYLPPDRKILQGKLLPALARTKSRVLFVGVARYTGLYANLLQPAELTTVDPDTDASRFGGPRHIVAAVQDLAVHVPDGSFDGAVLTGVIGFGINDPVALGAAVAALHRALVPGGTLVVGWNPRRAVGLDPAAHLRACSFRPAVLPGLKVSEIRLPLPFVEREHVFGGWSRT